MVRTWDELTCDWFVVMLELDVVTASGLQRECRGTVKTTSGFQCLEVVSHIFGKYVETLKRVMK